MPTNDDQRIPGAARGGAPHEDSARAPLREAVTPLMLALAVLVVALLATWFVWRSASTEVQTAQRAEFAYQVRQLERRITDRMATYEQVQRGTQAFLLGSMRVAPDDFHTFVASLRLDQTYPGIQGVALAEIVAPSQLEAHVRAMRQRLPDYQVHPVGPRAQYSAITHIEPFTGLNLRASGFDMLTDPTRRAAMERARDTGQAAASGKVRLIQENGKDAQAGLVMYLPVYRRGAATATVEQRRESIIGWVGAPFRMDDLMAGLVGERAQDIALSIYDGERADDSARLYRSRQESLVAPAMFAATSRVLIAGRPWTLQMRSAPLFEARVRSDRPQIIASVGTAAAFLLALLVWSLASGRTRAVALAAHMTDQLRESEYRWKYALEGAGDGVWDWNRATDEVVYSQRWKQMLGYGDSDIDNSAKTWRTLIHPDDEGQVQASLRAYAASTSASYEAQFRMRCKDGSWRWIRARGMAVTRNAAGHPLRTIGTHSDITRSKQDEQTLLDANVRLAAEQHRVRVILDHTHDAFIAVGPDGRVSDWNAKAEAMFGWSAAEVVGRDLATLLIPPAIRDDYNATFHRYASRGAGAAPRNVIETTTLHRDGHEVPVELAVAGIPQAGGSAAGVVSAFVRDISERKAAERQAAERSKALDDARSALQHAQKLEAVGKLTGGVAHDFNNVLHIIGGNLQLMQLWHRDDARLHQRLRSMQAAVDKGAKLSSQLLAFGRRQPLQPLVVNPLQTLQAMDDLLQRALGEAVRVQIEADDELWNTLVDPGQWENVILNLAINARDAMADGGVLTIGLRNVTMDAGHAVLPELPAGDYIRFTFADTGAGMNAEVITQAFEPFFTTKPVGQGTGLGLSMAYGFVKQSGGHIALESRPGEGTTVVIYLPRSVLQSDSKAAATQPNAIGGDETILVVEDDADVRATAVSTLMELGYRVLEAEDGTSALAILRHGIHIDLLFTDVVMPGPVSSTELAALARQHMAGIAVLFTSGYTRDALTTGGRLDAGVRLLSKPYRREQLAQQVRDALATQSREAATEMRGQA